MNKPHIEGSESTQSPVEQRKARVVQQIYGTRSLISELELLFLMIKDTERQTLPKRASERAAPPLPIGRIFTKNLDTDIDNTRTMPEQPNPEQSYDPSQ